MPRNRDRESPSRAHDPPSVVEPGESETLLARSEPAAQRTAPAYPGPPPGRPHPEEAKSWAQRFRERLMEARGRPFLRLATYYVVLVAVMSVLVYYVPAVREAFLSSQALTLEEGGGFVGPVGEDFGARVSLNEALRRAMGTLLVILGALSLVVPVAWVYMLTKRFRYDPALVSSVIILPIVVAGIALVVKNSVALAFALAGIVAAVRFRNTLKDPRDAVYIFLVIGIGLSSGVQALDVALAMSLAFNYVVLLVWKFNVGSIYSGRYARTGILSVRAAAAAAGAGPGGAARGAQRMLEQAAGDPHRRHPPGPLQPAGPGAAHRAGGAGRHGQGLAAGGRGEARGRRPVHAGISRAIERERIRAGAGGGAGRALGRPGGGGGVRAVPRPAQEAEEAGLTRRAPAVSVCLFTGECGVRVKNDWTRRAGGWPAAPRCWRPRGAEAARRGWDVRWGPSPRTRWRSTWCSSATRGCPTPPASPCCARLQHEIAAAPDKSFVIFLGDNLYPVGLADTLTEPGREGLRILRAQMQPLRETRTRGLFVPGNHDWAQGAPEGWSNIVRQERLINTEGAGLFGMEPRDGCPGPVVVDLGSLLRVIAIDSHWWLHPSAKGGPGRCNPGTEQGVVDSIRVALATAGDRRTIVVAHHPIVCGGQHGGYFDWPTYLFPFHPWARVAGLFARQDVTGREYRHMSSSLARAFVVDTPTVYAAGHEHNLQVFRRDPAKYLLVSGAGIYGHTTPTRRHHRHPLHPPGQRLPAHHLPR